MTLYLSDRPRPTSRSLRIWGSTGRRCGSGYWLLSATAPRGRSRAGPVSRPLGGQVASPDVLEEENKQLKDWIEELELERDILRKAAKFFAGETNW